MWFAVSITPNSHPRNEGNRYMILDANNRHPSNSIRDYQQLFGGGARNYRQDIRLPPSVRDEILVQSTPKHKVCEVKESYGRLGYHSDRVYQHHREQYRSKSDLRETAPCHYSNAHSHRQLPSCYHGNPRDDYDVERAQLSGDNYGHRDCCFLPSGGYHRNAAVDVQYDDIIRSDVNDHINDSSDYQDRICYRRRLKAKAHSFTCQRHQTSRNHILGTVPNSDCNSEYHIYTRRVPCGCYWTFSYNSKTGEWQRLATCSCVALRYSCYSNNQVRMESILLPCVVDLMFFGKQGAGSVACW